MDARLSVIGVDQFKNSRVLDVGCGDGKFCLDLFLHSEAKMVLGIDLDAGLIKIASNHVSKISIDPPMAPTDNTSAPLKLSDLKEMPKSFQSILKNLGMSNIKPMSLNTSQTNYPFSNRLIADLSTPKKRPAISFEVSNILSFHPPVQNQQKFDIITCFSLTKWVHLNWGDEGLLTLFKKIRDSLKLGGLLILDIHT